MTGIDRGPRTSAVCPAPIRRAVMTQSWYDLAYIHFKYDADEVAKLLPAGLEVDLHDGAAWVGLIPFSMRGIGIPHTPAVPWLGSFPEVNVRTYVVHNGVPGVWFLSLDVNRFLPALVARTTYRLPYCWGKASNELHGDVLTTRVHRRWPKTGPSTSISVKVGDEIQTPSSLEIFLSARWGLFSRGFGRSIRYAPVEHPVWPLRRGELLSLDDTLITAAGLNIPSGDPHVMFSSGVPVRVGLPRTVE